LENERKLSGPDYAGLDKRRSGMVIMLCLVLGVLTFTSMSAARLVFTLYAIELGAQPATVGMLFSAMSVVPFLLSLPFGAVSDRHGSRWLMVAGFTSLATGLALVHFLPSLPMLFAASALNGLLVAINNVALQHVMGVTSAPEQRARNFSNFALTGATSNFLGPLVAGVSVDHLGYGDALLVVLAIAVAGAALLLPWGGVLPRGRAHADSRERAPETGARDSRAGAIWPVLTVSALLQLAVDVYLFFMPVYGREVGLSATTIGSVMAMFAVASFVIRVAIPNLHKRLGDAGLLVCSFLFTAAGFALTPLFHSAWLLALVSFLVGLGSGCGLPVTMMLVVARSAAGRAGRTLGLQLALNSGARTLGPAVLGVLGSLVGIGPVFVFSALVMGAGALVSRRYLGRK
jgi:MFS family permease